jgi:hypothetical protein
MILSEKSATFRDHALRIPTNLGLLVLKMKIDGPRAQTAVQMSSDKRDGADLEEFRWERSGGFCCQVPPNPA